MTIRGVIFDLGWTLLDYTGDLSTSHIQRGLDLGRFLREQGFELDGAAVFARYRREMSELWEAGRPLNYEYPARLAMLRALRDILRRGMPPVSLATRWPSALTAWYHNGNPTRIL